jgi:hypothetical protein
MLPAPRCEFVDSARGILTDTLQHIDGIVVGIDVLQAAGDDQALHDSDVLVAKLDPAI